MSFLSLSKDARISIVTLQLASISTGLDFAKISFLLLNYAEIILR